MRLKKSNIIIYLIISVVLPLLVFPLSYAKTKDYEGKTVSWTLSNASIVSPGKTVDIDQGVLTTDYTIQATAESVDAPITNGTFKITLTSFSPSPFLKMAGQESGVWFVTGQWEIIDQSIAMQEVKTKHHESILKGRLSAELPFNPAEAHGDFFANAKLPLTLIGKHWGKGDGYYTGNELFEGQFQLTIERWQKVK